MLLNPILIVVVGLVTRNVLPSVNVVLVSFVGGYPGMLWGMTVMASDSRPRVHADVVIIALDDHLVSVAATVSLVMSMSMVVVVVMMVVVSMPRAR